MAPYPELLWVFDALQIDPRTVPDGCEDGWICFLNMRLDRTIPAILPQYRREHAEGRALYVTGIPASTSQPDMVAFFSSFGNVDKCIVLVDMLSQETFRWVVMTSRQECARVLGRVHGQTFEDDDEYGRKRVFILRICPAIGPDEEHVNIDPQSSVNQTLCEARYEYTFNAVPFINLSKCPSLDDPQDRLVIQGAAEHDPFYEGAGDYEREHSGEYGGDYDGEYGEEYGEYSEGNQEEYSGVHQEEEEVDEERARETPGIPTIIATPADGFVTQVSSWANIAGVANPSHQNINIQPASRVGPRLKPVGRIPSISGPGRFRSESQTQQARVVHVLNIPQNLTLQNVSDAITEGSLRAIEFGKDHDATRYCAVVFQHASEAEAWHNVLMKERAAGKPGRFNFVANSNRNEPFPMDSYLHSMGPPTYASRRLTIVKKGIFFTFKEHHLIALCHKIVGIQKCQVIHCYNGGNATAIFADVKSATEMKHHLEEKAEGRLPGNHSAQIFEGLSVTYSKDPCVFPVEFKTSIHDL